MNRHPQDSDDINIIYSRLMNNINRLVEEAEAELKEYKKKNGYKI